MYANSFSITIAGSEGTATALAGATFLLSRHPREYERAVTEVRRAFDSEADITSSTVFASAPFIEAVLQETMRLYPPVSITMPRRVPHGGATIDGRFVVAGTTVGVNHLSCYRSSCNFEDAMSFRPERWLRPSGKDASSDENFEAFRESDIPVNTASLIPSPNIISHHIPSQRSNKKPRAFFVRSTKLSGQKSG